MPKYGGLAGIVVLLAQGLSGVEAAGQERLEITEAVTRALSTHPSLTVASMGVERAAANVRDAESGRLPSLFADAGATRFGDAMVVAPLHGFNPQMPPAFNRTLMQASVSLSYSLFDASRRPRIDRTEALVAAAEANEGAARQALAAHVANAWLTVRTAREVVAAHDASVAALERERDRALQFFESGRAARVLMLRAEAALSAARADRATSTGQLDAAERELARLMGVALTDVAGRTLPAVALGAGSRTVDRAEFLEHAASNNAELARLRRQVDAAEAAGAEARALWYPRLQLSGRLVEYASGAGHESAEWQGGAQLSYALFTGGARNAAAERAAAERGAARAELSLAQLRIADGIDRAIAAWTAADGRVEALEASVAQMMEVTRIERLALDAGAGVQTDYLVAEAGLLRARASLTEARQAAVSARIQLALITGELSGQWLADNVETIQ